MADKTPLERQQDAEVANTRVTDTGERIDGDPVEGDPVPVGTGMPFVPPVGAHEIPDDKGGADGQEPQADLVLRAATLEKEEEAQDAAREEKRAAKADQVKDESNPPRKAQSSTSGTSKSGNSKS